MKSFHKGRQWTSQVRKCPLRLRGKSCQLIKGIGEGVCSSDKINLKEKPGEDFPLPIHIQQ